MSFLFIFPNISFIIKDSRQSCWSPSLFSLNTLHFLVVSNGYLFYLHFTQKLISAFTDDTLEPDRTRLVSQMCCSMFAMCKRM